MSIFYLLNSSITLVTESHDLSLRFVTKDLVLSLTLVTKNHVFSLILVTVAFYRFHW